MLPAASESVQQLLSIGSIAVVDFCSAARTSPTGRRPAPGSERKDDAVELRHLETLLAIDEEGSFTAAADALNTVQSNVSEQVRQLEAELGVPLLVRGRRGAGPTEFGTVVLERARRV